MSNNTTGQWGALQPYPYAIIHAVILSDGKILTFGFDNQPGAQGQRYHSVFDPVTGQNTLLDHQHTTSADVFCSAAMIIPGTNQVIMTGGTAPVGNVCEIRGAPEVSVFDPATQHMTNMPEGNMFAPRWYPTVISLPSGQIVVLGGSKSDANNVFTGQPIPEIFTPGEGWRKLPGALENDFQGTTGDVPFYPKAFLNGAGEIIYFFDRPGAAHPEIMVLDPSGEGSLRQIGTLPFDAGYYGQPAIMYDTGKVLIMAGNGDLWTMDISGATPTFVNTGVKLPTQRDWSNMTVLADGSVIITGGGSNDNNPAAADKTGVIWNPATNTVTNLPAEVEDRLYHSVGILLADGTVMSMGGTAGPNNNYQIYKPPYLFDADGNLAARPVISGAPTSVQPGDTFTITVDNAAAITKLTFSMTGAVTHSANATSGFTELEFTRGPDNTLIVKVPGDANDLSAGNWMLFAWNDEGVPSVAPIITIAPTGASYDGIGDLRADYFTINANATTLEQVNFDGPVAHTDRDVKIDESGTAGHYKGGPGADFAVKYTGDFTVSKAGEYTLYLTADEAANLFIDGQQVHTQTTGSSTTPVIITVTLTAGEHAFELRYMNGAGTSKLDLDWSGPGFGRTQMTFDGADDNLIVNGTFEHNGTPGTGKAPFGWTTTSDGGLFRGGQQETGEAQYNFSPGANKTGASTQQTIDTVAGQTYTLTFSAGITWQLPGSGALNAQIKAEALDGATAIASQNFQVGSNTAAGYNSYTITFTATGPKTTIKFTETSPVSTVDFNLGLDNVVVKPADGSNPGPVDPNQLDFSGGNAGKVVDLDAGTWANASRILLLGDSLTEGAGVPGGYRDILYDRLAAEKNVLIDFVGARTTNPAPGQVDANHQGTGGITAATIAGQASAIANANPHDIALIMLGTNDANGAFSPQAIANNLLNILKSLYAANSNVEILLATIPFVAPAARQAVITETNKLLPAIVEQAKALGIDVKLVDFSSIGAADLGDGVHPNPAGLQKWADIWLNSLLQNTSLAAGTLDGRPNSTNGADNVIGSASNDRIIGNSDSNWLDGGLGNDYLDGRGGSNVLTGGGGADTFAFSKAAAGSHQVMDFVAGDSVLLKGFGFTDAAAASAAFTQSGANVVFTSQGTTITFANATVSAVRNAVQVAVDPTPPVDPGNLATNGSFETGAGTMTMPMAHVMANGQVPGWTSSANRIEVWMNGHNGVTGTDGRNVVEIDAQNGVLSQTIQTEAGKAYGITFDYAGQAGALASSAMQVLWNGVVIATINPTDAAFQNHHIHAHGTGGNDVLAFRALAGDTDTVGGLLDKVVVAVSDHPVVNPPVDTISGTAGNDELFDTAGNDTINAGDGNDTIVLGSGGNDTVDGGAGIDGADFHGSASDYVITKNADGTTTVSNAAYGTDTLKNIETLWFAGEERAYDIDTLTPSNPPAGTISGTAGNDELFDTPGNDTINAGDGNDTIVLGSGGNDTVDGGAGIDGADFHGSASDYVITKNADGTTTVSNAAYGTDTLKNIETLWFAGEERAYDIDTLTPGSPPAGTISGTAGNDELFDTAANDTINAGDGNDTIVLGSRGNDTVDGGAGVDSADFHGAASDYSFTSNADGTITVSNAAYGTDTLKNIETLWFAGEAKAYDVADLAPPHEHDHDAMAHATVVPDAHAHA